MNDDTSLLWAFCAAARHSPQCYTWQEHRNRLTEYYAIINAQLKALPDAMAIGKSVQTARENKQTSVTGKQWDPLMLLTESPEDTVVHVPFVSEWFVVDDVGRRKWTTKDMKVKKGRTEFWWQYQEDARASAIEAYKPQRVKIFWDGQEDEWNQWR